jgi:hypothetical protein
VKAPLMRIVDFRPVGGEAATDASLRRTLTGSLGSARGLSALVVGRRGPDHAGQRVMVSVWDGRRAMDAAVGRTTAVELAGIDLPEETDSLAVDVLPLVLALEFERVADAHILRVFRGVVREGEFDAYIHDLRHGTLADVAATHGPHALYVGTGRSSKFVTVSIWAEWEQVEAATGGDIRNPVATQHAHRLASWTASHFEILPGVAKRTNVLPDAT